MYKAFIVLLALFVFGLIPAIPVQAGDIVFRGEGDFINRLVIHHGRDSTQAQVVSCNSVARSLDISIRHGVFAPPNLRYTSVFSASVGSTFVLSDLFRNDEGTLVKRIRTVVMRKFHAYNCTGEFEFTDG